MKTETQQKLILALLKAVEHQWLTAEEYIAGSTALMHAELVAQLVEETQPHATVENVQKPATRKSTSRKHVTIEQHQQIVDTFLATDGSVQKTCRLLKIHPTTVINHVQYAGLVDVPSQYYIDRIVSWRTNHKMYLNDPLPKIKNRPEEGYGIRP